MNRQASLFLALVSLTSSIFAQDKVTYADHARAIMENKCFSCHNPDKKKGDLDLTSFAGVMGGGGGGAIVDAGNADGSKLIGTITKKTEPYMPPEGAPLGDADIAILKKWIDGGLLDTSSSVARKSTKPKVELTVASGSGKPTGTIARPDNILLEPVVVTPHTTAINAMAASPWTGLLAVAVPKQVLIYDTETRLLAGILPYPEGYASSLRFSRSGALLILGGGKGGKFGHAVVWDVKTGKRVTEVGKEFDAVMSADITPDHKKIVIGSPSKKVKVYDTATGEELYTIGRHTNWILGTAFSPDGILLATCDRDGNVFVWEADGGGEFFLLGQHKGGAALDLAWRSDSNVLASCSRDGTIIVWEMNEGKQLKSWTAHSSGVESVSFTPDGRLVSCGQDGLTRVWDVNGNKLAEMPNQGDVVGKTVALFDDKVCATGNWRGELKFFDLKSGAELGQASANPGLIATRIAQAEARIVELNAKLAPTTEAANKANEAAKAATDAAAKAKADMVANEGRKNALPGEIKAAQEQLAKDRAALDKLTKDRVVRVAALKAFGEKQTKIADLEKQLAPLAAEAAKLATTDKVKTDAVAALESAKKEASANNAAAVAAAQAKVKDAAAKLAAPDKAKLPPTDASIVALKAQADAANKEVAAVTAATPSIASKLKDIEGKLAVATTALASAAKAKQGADALLAQINPLKQALGAAPGPIVEVDKAIADINAKIRAGSESITAKNAELPKSVAAAKTWPDRVKAADAAVVKANEVAAAAQAAAKAVPVELAIMQRAVPSLKAAQFNVGVLSEKDKLAKLEADFQSFTDGVADNESARAAAVKRIEESKKAIDEATAAQAGLDAKAKQTLVELEPVEKVFTATKATSDSAAVKVEEQRKILATKEAELAALVKAKDDGIAAAKKAGEEIAKQIEAHKKSVATAITKVAQPNKRVETEKAALATAEAAATKAKAAQTEAKTKADHAPKDVSARETELTKAKSENEAAAKALVDQRPLIAKAQAQISPTKNAAIAKEKEFKAAQANKQASVVALEKEWNELRTKAEAAEKEVAALAAILKTGEQTAAAKKTAYEAATKALAVAKAAGVQAQQVLNTSNNAVAQADRKIAERKNALTVAEKDAAGPRGILASAQANLDGATKAQASKLAEPAALEKTLAEKAVPVNAAIAAAKAVLPALEKTLAETSAKTAADQKVLEAKRAEVGAAQAAADGNKKKKSNAEAAIVAATKEIPEREKNIAEGKSELAKLQPQLDPQRTKVKQLTEQFLALLPK